MSMRIHANLKNTYPSIKLSRNPIQLFRMMKLYSKERQNKFPNFSALSYSLNSMLNNCRLKLLKDSSGKILAAYTYKIRRNRFNKRSMYIDALVRNRSKALSKKLMPNIYQDMKSTAMKKKADELTLFSLTNDKKLREKYERLGFRKDESVYITGGYIMRVKLNKFLEGIDYLKNSLLK